MAVEYHLLTALGLTTSVTLSTADTVTLTNHGLRAGHSFRFLSTSTTLPQIGGSTVSTNAVYYVSATDNTSNAFKISSQADGSDVLDITNAGSGVKIVGGYWASLPETDPGGGGNYRQRYGSAGSERVFSSMSGWRTYAAANPDLSKDVVVEIEGKWTDASTATSVPFAYSSVKLTTKINGAYGSGFHQGVLGAGYYRKLSVASNSVINPNAPFVTIEGLQIENTATSGYAVQTSAPMTKITQCILTGYYGGLYDNNSSGEFTHNIAINCVVTGFYIAVGSSSATVWANNLATKCGTGFNGSATGTASSLVNNISYGNTINWWNVSGSFSNLCSNNAGESGDTIPKSATGVAGINITESDFVNWDENDFRPTSSSALVDGGIVPRGITPVDIANHVRPNYEAATYPANHWDIGPFEYDHGDGLAPEVLIVTNLTSGSRVIATRHDTGASLGTAVESGGTATISVAYSGTVDVEARNASSAPYYKPWSTQISFPTTKNVIALQEED